MTRKSIIYPWNVTKVNKIVLGWFLLVKCRPNFELSINKGFPLALCSIGSPDTPIFFQSRRGGEHAFLHESALHANACNQQITSQLSELSQLTELINMSNSETPNLATLYRLACARTYNSLNSELLPE